MTENNPYLRRLDSIKEARKKFEESEWRLTFLRPVSATKPPEPTDEQLILWNQQLSQHSN
jgi:hypothetical protein